jgi:hypothetical protein
MCPSERPPHGPIIGCHMAGRKCSKIVHEKILKKILSLAGPPNLADHAKLGPKLNRWDMDSSITNYSKQTICYIYILQQYKTQKGEACGFDPGTSSPICALIIPPKPTGHRPYIVTNAEKNILNVEAAQPEKGGTHTV